MLGSLLRRCQKGGEVWKAFRRNLVAGQPVHETHPELLQPGEVAPGISTSELDERRKKLSAAIPPKSVAVLSAADAITVAGIREPYRQDANFLYLTGINQQAVAVIKNLGTASSGDGRDHLYILFVPTASERDQWDGHRIDCEGAKKYFGAHEAYPMSMLSRQLPSLVRDASAVLFDSNSSAESTGLRHEVKTMLVAGAMGGPKPLSRHVQSLRVKKSPGEIALMRQSALIASRAMRGCMEMTSPGISEHVLAAHFEYSCKLGGAQRLAYPPIVASGPDNCTIHYSRNDKSVKGDDMILMDAGCDLYGYASDVTRTWPASGQFSGPQKDLYEVVLATHNKIMNACCPGVSIKQLHALSINLLSEGLADLGIGRMASQALIYGHYRTFYPHMIGHFLGLDVHDTGSIPKSDPLAPGSILAIEPGLYIPDDEDFGYFRGLGIRVEDDVLVTEKGPVVLSTGVPSEIHHIEKLASGDHMAQEETPAAYAC